MDPKFILKKYRNTRRQGDAGVGIAIAWFMSQGYTVSVPIGDPCDYDLVVEVCDGLKRVQVKTTTYVRNGAYHVQLATKGGNQSWNGVSKRFSSSGADLLFVVTGAGDQYLIPSEHAPGSEIRLGEKYKQFKL